MNSKSAYSDASLVARFEGQGAILPTSQDGRNVVFAFGKNWERFLARISAERIKRACESLSSFMDLQDLKGKTFLDIGSGSGLFSYAAYLLGAERVVSFDADPFSVECGRYLHDKAGRPTRWTIQQGSVLDINFLGALGTFDIVYSWGVLHHTGNMWQAIRNSARLAADNGLYYIALYNRKEGRGGSQHWVKIKRRYNTSSRPVQRLMEWYYAFTHPVGRSFLKLQNPVKALKQFGSGRGMYWKTDLLDWLGGYPYEFATVDEVFGFMKKEFPSFTLTNLKTEPGLGNNWFLYRSRT